QQVGMPPFIKSPYGVVHFPMNPTTFTVPSPFVPPGYELFFADFPKATFPDGTPIPSAVINDPCRNPF
ncbi:MAG: hypothetical protein ACXWUL_00620, partial [Caldimonas sp.]